MKWITFFATLIIAQLAYTQQVEELTFTSETLELNASLYLPEGDGPFKAAVLVHGSGPVNRYQTIPLNDGNSECVYPQLYNETVENFRDIASYLQANGVAVLTYDKRTFTHGESLDPITVSTKDFVTDAENAVTYLSSRSEIDNNQIFLIGHSQGAALIPIVAQNVNVSGLISLAGAITPPDSLVANQFRNLYIECLGDTVSGDTVANSFFEEFSKIRNNELADNEQIFVNFPGNPNLIPYGFPTFWTDWFEMTDNVIANYNNANLPILIIHGTDDWNVSVEDALRFKNALSTDLTRVEIFEGINHFLTPADNPVVDANILQAISSWIGQPVVMPNVTLYNIFKDVSIVYANGKVSINNANNFDAAIISTIDGKLLKNRVLKNEGFFNFEVPNKAQILLVGLIKDDYLFTKKLISH